VSETLAQARDRTAKELRFDGVFRAYPWLSLDSWRPIAYVSDGRLGKETFGEIHPTEAAAIEECNQLNRKSAGRVF
jgi:hypothetical protein